MAHKPLKPARVIVAGDYSGATISEPGIPLKPTSLICPQGLEPLVGLKHVVVNQAFYMTENYAHLPKHFDVLTEGGVRIYHAAEVKDPVVAGTESGIDNSYNLLVYGHDGQPVFQIITEPETCCSFGIPKTSVFYTGNHIGSIVHKGLFSCGKSSFKITDSKNKVVLRIKSAQRRCSSWNTLLRSTDKHTIEFNIYVDKRRLVGKITKILSGSQYASSADHFKVTMPMEMDLYVKALLLGAAIVLDNAYFHKDPSSEQYVFYAHSYAYN